eukprot:2454886-Rhodomonas_salina.2
MSEDTWLKQQVGLFAFRSKARGSTVVAGSGKVTETHHHQRGVSFGHDAVSGRTSPVVASAASNQRPTSSSFIEGVDPPVHQIRFGNQRLSPRACDVVLTDLGREKRKFGTQNCNQRARPQRHTSRP